MAGVSAPAGGRVHRASPRKRALFAILGILIVVSAFWRLLTVSDELWIRLFEFAVFATFGALLVAVGYRM